jgi:hypothetical protein
MVSEKEGHPVPLSNFEAAGIRGVSHAAQLYVPVLGYCLSRGELPARSVPRPTSTSKDSGESCAFHSACVQGRRGDSISPGVCGCLNPGVCWYPRIKVSDSWCMVCVYYGDCTVYECVIPGVWVSKD